MTSLILASRSPRRRELIRLLNLSFHSRTADVDEGSITHPDPTVNVMDTAALKGQAIAESLSASSATKAKIIVAADTSVSVDREMLGKPIDAADAWRMLRQLRNRTHQVHTGISLIELDSGRQIRDVHTALVTMRNYSDDEIAAYIATGDPMDKAGAYAIQHPIFRPVKELTGCFTGVMGLSLCHLLQRLHQFGVPMRAELAALREAHQQFPCPLLEQIKGSLS